MNYIDNACKKRALSNLHPALKLQEGSVVRTAGKECGETARWLKATTAESERVCHSLQSKQRFTPLVSFLLLSQLSIVCYFVSVKLLCYSTQGGNDLTLWGWSYFGLLFLNFLTIAFCNILPLPLSVSAARRLVQSFLSPPFHPFQASQLLSGFCAAKTLNLRSCGKSKSLSRNRGSVKVE